LTARTEEEIFSLATLLSRIKNKLHYT